jgi:hypothetical protein
MNLPFFADLMQHTLGTFQLDDSSVALLALLGGMMAGYRLTGWHDRLKARRARVARSQDLPRKRD